ncbi:MAG TPA: hypothetical protein DEP61_01480 [Lachnospiraceae bacterium]|nr:hypothetical protein [Lachnospiraceae bacterium]
MKEFNSPGEVQEWFAENNADTVGQMCRLLKEDRGITVRALCKKGGLATATYQRICHDEPSYLYDSTCRKLETAFDIPRGSPPRSDIASSKQKPASKDSPLKQKINHYRKLLGWSQERLALESEVSIGRFAQLNRQEMPFSTEQQENLCYCFAEHFPDRTYEEFRKELFGKA